MRFLCNSCACGPVCPRTYCYDERCQYYILKYEEGYWFFDDDDDICCSACGYSFSMSPCVSIADVELYHCPRCGRRMNLHQILMNEVAQSGVRSKTEPLTWDELVGFDQSPVWIENIAHPTLLCDGWALMDLPYPISFDSEVVKWGAKVWWPGNEDESELYSDEYGVTWQAYGRKPKGANRRKVGIEGSLCKD